jgi:hypothetical protein
MSNKLADALKRMYESVDKMNLYLLKGREQIAQQQIHKQFQEAQKEI